MNTNKLIYNDSLPVRSNMETVFNWLRWMMEQFDHGRVSYDKVQSTDDRINKAEAQTAYMSMMTGVEIPEESVKEELIAPVDEKQNGGVK